VERRYVVLLVIVLGVLAAVAGVSRSYGAKKAGPITLTMWSYDNQDPGLEPVLKKLSKQFEQTHPGVKINLVFKDFNSLVGTVPRALASGSGPDVTEGNLRMARIPADPAHVFRNRRGMAPGTVYEAKGKRIFVLPGVPLEMKGIFTEELEPQFLDAGSAATVRELRFTFAVEARFYPLMRELEEKYPDVSVGSYPNFETKELVIRCVGADPKRVEEALEVIRRRAPV